MLQFHHDIAPYKTKKQIVITAVVSYWKEICYDTIEWNRWTFAAGFDKTTYLDPISTWLGESKPEEEDECPGLPLGTPISFDPQANRRLTINQHAMIWSPSTKFDSVRTRNCALEFDIQYSITVCLNQDMAKIETISCRLWQEELEMSRSHLLHSICYIINKVVIIWQVSIN